MKKGAKSNSAGAQSAQRSRLPLLWDEVPHHAILEKAQQSMALRSAARAADDSLRLLLKRRLPNNDPSDHMRYIEIESAHIVETLRHLRDQYRSYLEKRGCKPIAEMYWVVVRHGVKDWAIMALRSVAVEYIAASRVDNAKWNALFDFSGPYNILAPALESQLVSKTENAQVRLSKSIASLLPQTAFDLIIDGGPFGREYQMYLARSYPGRAFLESLETFPEVIKRRERSWEDARPWSEGLAALFEVTRQEVLSQFDALGEEAKEAERGFVKLSDFERISYTHLVSFARGEIVTEGTAADRWPKLMLALDEAGLQPGGTLEGIPRETLMVSRRKGAKLETWSDCYASCAGVTLEDGKVRTLRREVTHAIHNAAKKANYQLGKVWSRKRTSAVKPKKTPSS